MSYELDLAFTNAQLQTIWITGTNVIVAKPSGGNSPNVAWQVFKPMTANSLNWEENYGVYASTAQVQNGAQLTQLSSTGIPAAMETLYTLAADGAISTPGSGGSANAFALLNQYQSSQGYMTVGLYQNATVNGTQILGNAVSAAPVLYQSTATMTPYTTVYIWLASQVVSNSVVTQVTSPMTEVVFGGGNNTASLAYDSATGMFIASSTNTSSKLVLTQHEALL
ncbi:hypothetical protein [Massilia rubra]|uniref:Uncharacterized protein n=1 Tax=Massilia rubra TaxID=2607910 RepID=A0ABX0LLV2_9BURK|nr:hypothetical protein [Massilia rubra]NHZ32917.1 hypothetical protein [Massilia rubra]